MLKKSVCIVWDEVGRFFVTLINQMRPKKIYQFVVAIESHYYL